MEPMRARDVQGKLGEFSRLFAAVLPFLRDILVHICPMLTRLNPVNRGFTGRGCCARGSVVLVELPVVEGMTARGRKMRGR